MVEWLKTRFRSVKASRFLSNVTDANHEKRALVSYTIYPFLKGEAIHSNGQESKVIAQLFDELGYSADVIHYTNSRCLDYSKYDVIFGFGLPFENSFTSSRKIKRIYYATGAHVCFQNHAEIQRIQAVNEKRAEYLTPKRIVPWMWSQSTTMSDALIVIGNEWTKSTYTRFTNTPIYPINATALVNDKTKNIYRNIAITKKNFIWFGSAGLIHKGLDICLEYFIRHPEFQLHICGPKEEDFFQIYHNELSQPNIHLHGFVDVQSSLFIEIISQCSFAVLPTCSEGQATSLLTAMGGGLIPISTEYSGIDVQDYGFLIPTLSVGGLEEAINIAIIQSDDNLKKMSMHSQERIHQAHTINSFKTSMKSILSLVVLDEK